MELPDKEILSLWLTQYGSFALFGLLAVGIIALPVPEETLLMLSGFLISQGTLRLVPTAIASLAGSMCGITVSYLIGRAAGKFVLERYGIWVGLTHERLQQIHNWFERFGKWTLFFGYFIPGVRHFTGFTAGMTGLEYHSFAVFAYTGAFFWVTIFLSIGYFLGDYWATYFEGFEVTIEEILIIVLLAGLALIMIRYLTRANGRSKNNH